MKILKGDVIVKLGKPSLMNSKDTPFITHMHTHKICKKAKYRLYNSSLI